MIDGVAVLLVLALPMAPIAHGQAARASSPGPRILLVSSGPASPASGGNIVREIDDPHNGDRWLLERDPGHPGGPGRLLLVSVLRKEPLNANQAQAEASAPVIRSGDRVLVEENTPVVEARLEAVALAPAQPGSVFNVRLTVGGRVVRAVAVSPGRAVFQGDTGR
jgi:hypothetical protein